MSLMRRGGGKTKTPVLQETRDQVKARSGGLLTCRSTTESNNTGHRSARAGPRGPGEPPAPGCTVGQSSVGKPLVPLSMDAMFPDGSGTTCDKKIGPGISCRGGILGQERSKCQKKMQMDMEFK